MNFVKFPRVTQMTTRNNYSHDFGKSFGKFLKMVIVKHLIFDKIVNSFENKNTIFYCEICKGSFFHLWLYHNKI